MRQSHQDKQWLLAKDGTLQGLCLGYDGCAEHEGGIQLLESRLGVPRPEFRIGPADRRIHHPEKLKLYEYMRKPHDKRRKPYPALLLLCGEASTWGAPLPAQDLAAQCDVPLYGDPVEKQHQPSSDLSTAWDERSFAVHVRGDENIARLRAIFEAAQRGDLALTSSGSGWLDRHGIFLVILSGMTSEQVREVTERDEAYRELILAARATGIEDQLRAAGKKWFALSPAWRDPRKEQVDFFLNPQGQDRYNFGWFTVEELRQWARDEGPVMLDKTLRALERSDAGGEIRSRVTTRLERHGLRFRHQLRLVWVDADKKAPGVLLHMHPQSESRLPSGAYAVEDLMARFPEVPAESPQS